MSTTDEILEIRGLARDFAAAELRPHAEAWDAERRLDPGIVPKLAELGFFGMLVPESAGGMGLDLETYLAALEELAWGEPAAALLVAESVVAADLIARFGGERGELLAALASGEQLGCIALSDEPASGQAAGARVRAEPRGTDWTLSGVKHWVTNGDRADFALVAAQENDGDGLFVVPRSAGYSTGARAATMGLRAVAVVPLELNSTTVGSGARLAWRGAAPTDALLPVGTLSATAIAIGIAQAALDHAVSYAAEREQFGRPLRAFEGIQYKLAEMATRTVAARAVMERAARQAENASAVAMAKLLAGACAMFVTTEAVQVFGGYGYMRDYPVEKLMRDARAMELLHGTSEHQRLRIAAGLYAD